MMMVLGIGVLITRQIFLSSHVYRLYIYFFGIFLSQTYNIKIFFNRMKLAMLSEWDADEDLATALTVWECAACPLSYAKLL